MPRLKDLTGRSFGRLVVVSLLPARSKSGNTQWRCRCACGNWNPCVTGSALLNGSIVSCGCYGRQESGRRLIGNRLGLKHGKSGTSNYHRWENMKARTSKPSHPSYHHYGGRGIKMHDLWFNSFTEFDTWIAENLGDCPDGYSIDRIDVDGNYEPSNVRWADARTQTENRRVNR